MNRRQFLAGFTAIAGSELAIPHGVCLSAQSATVPMSVEVNAPIIKLTFKKPDSGLRTARFLFDSGGGAIIFDQGLAKNIGLKPEGAVISADGQQYRAVEVPAAFLGGMQLDLRTSKAFVHVGAVGFQNRDKAEGLLPGKALEHYQLVLDYPRQQLSIGTPGSLPHRGKMLSAPYIASSGHPRVVASIDATSYGFLLDTGSQITLIREDLLRKWSREHPDWSYSTGAVGPANEGGSDIFLLRIPTIQLGPFTVKNVVAASRPYDAYSPTSYETPAPIVGALGGNVLRQFRVEIDYPKQLCYFEHSGREQASDFDTVGLVLDTNSKGQLVVRAVSSTASAVTRQNILPGDIVLQIGDTSGTPYTLSKAARALSGAVGERKSLRILRHGKPMTVTVAVARIL